MFPQAEFLLSAWAPTQFPSDETPEIAFAGRSNAGKSSAINAITGRHGLARTSKTPGQTQLVNFFNLEGNRRLVDLPGYGYAKVPPKMQQHWLALISGYFEQRTGLQGVVLVMDSRRGMTDLDWQMLEWARSRPIAIHLLMTKSDKLKRNEVARALKEVQSATNSFASAQLFSSVTKTGVDEARRTVLAILSGKKKPQ
jgi:GTP-binding protein